MSLKSQRGSPSPRVARRRARTRERILKEAGRLFSTHGIDAVTLADIAEAADVSRGNLYSHFDSKQELVHSIYAPVFGYASEQLDELTGAPPAQAIEGIVRIHFKMWRDFPGALSIAHQLHGTPIGDHAAEDNTYLHTTLDVFQRAAHENLLRVEPALAIKVFHAVAVPLLELCLEASDPEEFFVESMLKLLLRASDVASQQS
jgi:AcrR family transcriptional regulator